MRTSTGLPIRRSSRMKHFDYTSSGSYFITICSYQNRCTFSEVVADKVQLFPIGRIIEFHWRAIPSLYHGVIIDEWVVMPNHLHGVLAMPEAPPSAGKSRNPRGSLGRLIGAFKGDVTKDVRRMLNDPSVEVWQRGYWDSAIRNERALQNIREYIRKNPVRWAFDRENPEMSASKAWLSGSELHGGLI